MNLSQLILRDLTEIVPKYSDVLFAVDVMGSVARFKDQPRDLDISLWISVKVKYDDKLCDKLSEVVDAIADLAKKYEIGLDLREVTVEAVYNQLMWLVNDPISWFVSLQSIVDASAILHAIKAVDKKLAAILHAVYLLGGWENVSWHNIFVYGIENVQKLVKEVGLTKIRQSILALFSKFVLS